MPPIEIRPVPSEELFCQVAVERGFITPEQLAEALRAQTELRESGAALGGRLIGLILIDLGYMTREQTLAVLDAGDEVHPDETQDETVRFATVAGDDEDTEKIHLPE